MRKPMLVLLAGLLAISFVQADQWPEAQCDTQPVWYSFSEVGFCFPKSNIAKINHLNLSEPAAELTFGSSSMDPELYQVSFVLQSEDSGLSRLSDHIGHSVGLMLSGVAGGTLSAEHVELVSDILSLTKDSQISQYRRNNIEVTLIMRKRGAYNSMYMVIPGYQGLLYMAGEFSLSQAEDLISWIDVDSLANIAIR